MGKSRRRRRRRGGGAKELAESRRGSGREGERGWKGLKGKAVDGK